MPLMKGHSREVVSKNIKEMIKAGHKPKQAMAAALAEARKSKMAEGGKVDPKKVKTSIGQAFASEQPAAAPIKPLDKGKYYADGGMIEEEEHRGIFDMMRQGDQPEIANPHEQDMEKKLAMQIQEEDSMYAMGGLVEDGPMGDEPFGNKPSEDMSSASEEPMSEEDGEMAEVGHKPIMGVPKSMGLSSEAMAALEEKKRRRRFR